MVNYTSKTLWKGSIIEHFRKLPKRFSSPVNELIWAIYLGEVFRACIRFSITIFKISFWASSEPRKCIVHLWPLFSHKIISWFESNHDLKQFELWFWSNLYWFRQLISTIWFENESSQHIEDIRIWRRVYFNECPGSQVFNSSSDNSWHVNCELMIMIRLNSGKIRLKDLNYRVDRFYGRCWIFERTVIVHNFLANILLLMFQVKHLSVKKYCIF